MILGDFCHMNIILVYWGLITLFGLLFTAGTMVGTVMAVSVSIQPLKAISLQCMFMCRLKWILHRHHRLTKPN